MEKNKAMEGAWRGLEGRRVQNRVIRAGLI
jgi:hypothetical protein